jgi:release factor glutamine methyltransferase
MTANAIAGPQDDPAALTLVSAWTHGRRQLEAAGIDSPVLDARLLLEAAAGVPRLDIVTDPYRPLTADAVTQYRALLARRVEREPISHILGIKAFWTFDLIVGPAVLTPRPDTELLVDLALAHLAPDSLALVADLGTGSGAVLAALLRERPRCQGLGLDLSAAAAAVAEANIARLGLANRAEIRSGSWTDADWAQGARFDVVVSNPPYIPTNDIDALEPEVARFDPRLALDGGGDGLEAYRTLAPAIAAVLKPAGLWAVEIGLGQATDVARIFDAAGLPPAGERADLAGRLRVVYGFAPGVGDGKTILR